MSNQDPPSNASSVAKTGTGLVLIGLGSICIWGATNAALAMYTSFAPIAPSHEFLPGEAEAIERARNYFWPHVNIAVGLLLVAGLWMIWSGGQRIWRRGK